MTLRDRMQIKSGMTWKEVCVQAWLYTNQCWGRSYYHFVIPSTVLSLFTTLNIWFKISGYPIGIVGNIVALVLVMGALLYFGDWETRTGLFAKATSMSNQNNPELMKAAQGRKE